MGCVNVTPEGEKEAKDKSNQIDKLLRQSAKEYENTIKILLLGIKLRKGCYDIITRTFIKNEIAIHSVVDLIKVSNACSDYNMPDNNVASMYNYINVL